MVPIEGFYRGAVDDHLRFSERQINVLIYDLDPKKIMGVFRFRDLPNLVTKLFSSESGSFVDETVDLCPSVTSGPLQFFLEALYQFETLLPNEDIFMFKPKRSKELYLGLSRSTSDSGLLRFVTCGFDQNEEYQHMIPLVLLEAEAESFPSLRVRIHAATKEEAAKAGKICKILASIVIDGSSSFRSPSCLSVREIGMSFSEYSKCVNEAIAEMQSGCSLSKVVYSRSVLFTHSSRISPARLLQEVVSRTESQDGHNRYIIYLKKSNADETFISLTPETLCRIEDATIQTEALAGTFPNEQVPSLSEIGSKISHEHGNVSEYIQSKLAPLGDDLIVSPASLLRLSRLTHVLQTISQTSNTISGKELAEWAIRELNPTPAVCGSPLDRALDLIRRNEKFNRKNFSAPIGIVSENFADIAVGLRSAVVSGNTVALFAGAGIVIGSDPVEEWKEMDLKMSQFSSVLLGDRRPIHEIFCPVGSFPSNATEAVCAFTVEELVRQKISDFIVCPGSRSTPLTTAAHRHSNTKTYVIHDERSAGFFAVGLARSSGRIPAIIVTSGTAVANLLPAVCEAREAGIALICLTADRPSDSWHVGEYQTIKQDKIFSNFAGFEKSFPAPNSESPKILASRTIRSMLADIAFAAGEIAMNGNQIVHLNFELHKHELQPVEVEADFRAKFLEIFLKDEKLVRYCCDSSGGYTKHISGGGVVELDTTLVEDLVHVLESGKGVVVCGELRCAATAHALMNFCNGKNIPCIADVTSMMSPSSNILMGIDQLMNSDEFVKFLNKFNTIVRVGGPLISARTQLWASCHSKRVIRVLDDAGRQTRHDPQHSADMYLHMSLRNFLNRLSGVNSGRCLSVPVLGDMADRIRETYKESLSKTLPQFNEMTIARTVAECAGNRGSGLFLSSSMPCRDFDLCGSLVSTGSTRYVGCNRGANGIDGVIASALGYSRGIEKEVFLLIGDVATLHDLGSIALALNQYPGMSPDSPLGDLKIICVNNSGGCIFSFLPIASHKEVFSPYFDTPHGLKFEGIVNGMKGNVAVSVTSTDELEKALMNPQVRFIECCGLPSHVENVELHKSVGRKVVDQIFNPSHVVRE